VTRLLLLAGTEDAAALAVEASARFGRRLDLVASIAGGGASPVPRAGAVRIGGFGGAAGLARYLRAEGIDLVVDASDPFAASLSDAARCACETEAVPRIQLVPPGWPRDPLDRWIELDTVGAASAAVRRHGRRAFLDLGADDLAGFAGIHEVSFLVRLPAAPREKPPLHFYELALGRGPFTLAGERHLLARHAIDVVVLRAVGGTEPSPTLVAAREASLPVVLLRRPPPQPGDIAPTLAAVLDWLAARVG
jgi:precorrin-6A/cobalt-precorrin-6A reductase